VRAKALALETIAAAPPGGEGLLQAYQCGATCAAQLGELDEALAIFTEAIDVAADLPAAQYSLAAVHAVRSMALSTHGRFDEGRDDANAALAIARRIRNPTVQGLALQALGWALWAIDPEPARDAFEEAVTLMKSGAIEGGIDAARARLAPLRLGAGDESGANDALLETFSHMREIGERLSVVTALDSSLTVLTTLGEDEPAAVLAGVMRAESFGPLTAGMLTGAELERHEAALMTLRGRLGDDELQAFLDQGAAMDDHEAVAYALAALTRVRATLDAEPPERPPRG
jgi:tetratricopeptide (TPR) repeat protein